MLLDDYLLHAIANDDVLASVCKELHSELAELELFASADSYVCTVD